MEGYDPGKDTLRARTEDFAMLVIRLYTTVRGSTRGRTIGKRLLGSGLDVGALYRRATRAETREQFIWTLAEVMQALDETDYWLTIFQHAELVSSAKLSPVKGELRDLMSTFEGRLAKARAMPDELDASSGGMWA